MLEVVQWFLAPGSWGRSRFFKLAAATVIVLLLYEYRLSWRDQHSRSSSASALERRRREHVAHVTMIYNYSVGLVWPRNDADDDNDDRIMSQIDVMNVYARQKRSRKLKVILRVGNFNFDNWVAGQEQFVRDGCAITDCWMTNDRAQAQSADALLISEFDDSTRQLYLPKPLRQVWIAQHWESPLHNRIDPKAVRGLINWTASYRHDSTLVFRYGKMVPGAPATAAVTPGEASFNYAAGKTKLVAWFVSNCRAGNNRMLYAQELSQFIQVDIYGECGKLSCPRSEGQKCLELLERHYKFYLSFENSNCDDYITEKFWDVALLHKVIPVVMGARRQDYEAVAPAHSFVHVDDFSGPQQLADYLHLLAANDTLYNEYFRWREMMWSPVNTQYWCRLCTLLHWRDDVDYVSWYDDYETWWNGACQRSADLTWFQRNVVANFALGSPSLSYVIRWLTILLLIPNLLYSYRH